MTSAPKKQPAVPLPLPGPPGLGDFTPSDPPLEGLNPPAGGTSRSIVRFTPPRRTLPAAASALSATRWLPGSRALPGLSGCGAGWAVLVLDDSVSADDDNNFEDCPARGRYVQMTTSHVGDGMPFRRVVSGYTVGACVAAIVRFSSSSGGCTKGRAVRADYFTFFTRVHFHWHLSEI
jgi:hypothetical protein